MKFIPVFFVLLFILFSSAGRAITYFVDAANGDDANSGASPSSAFKTIQKAADTMAAGDSCRVFTGEYDERVMVNDSGASAAPIVYQAEGNVLMKGFKITADYIHIIGFDMTRWGVSVKGKYCQILNNNIHDVGFVGIDLLTEPAYANNSTCSNCIVKGNTIAYAVKCGIRVMGQNHLIEDNDISHTLECSPYTSYCDDADGIRFFGSGHIFRRNYIHDILHEPENFDDPHIDFFQTWKTAQNIIFEQNICVSPNTSGSNQIVMISEDDGETVSDLIFRNNIFIMSDPGYCAFNIHQKNPGGWIENIVIANNLFYHANPAGMGEYAIRLIGTRNVTVKNNAFYDFGDNAAYANYITIENSENIDIGNNSVYVTGGQAPYGGPFPNDVWMIDPLFLDPQNRNFFIPANSPLIDAGIALPEVSDDFAGTPRPQGSAYDIGVYEFTGDSLLSPPQNIRVTK